jgi:hypothetical protein
VVLLGLDVQMSHFTIPVTSENSENLIAIQEFIPSAQEIYSINEGDCLRYEN